MNTETTLFTLALSIYIISTVLFFGFLVTSKVNLAKLATSGVAVGFIAHTISIIVRTVEAGRLPLTNQYEFALSFAWGIALCFLIFMAKYKYMSMGAFVTPIIFLIMGYGAMQSKDISPLMPALQSNWLTLHVSTAVIGYGAFAVACGVSTMYVVGGNKQSSIMSRHMPTLEKLDLLSYRAIALGFLFLTLVIVSGAIWANYAWSRYWAWDPKETWSLITWIIYAVYLHARITRGWKGKKAAWFAIIGFAAVLFTYIGVNTVLSGLHSYF